MKMVHSLLMILIIDDGNGITLFLDDTRENNSKRICLKSNTANWKEKLGII